MRPQKQASPRPLSRAAVVETIWSPSAKNDTTIHLDMEVADDLHGWMEEFSRLKRLGHFYAAEQYFDDNLRVFSDIPPVMIEYADMLVEQGAYRRLRSLMSTHTGFLTLEGRSTRQSPVEETYRSLYRASLQLIYAFGALHFSGQMHEACKEVRSAERTMRSLSKLWGPTAPLDSAEIQTIRYALKILSQVERQTDIIPEIRFDYWSNCGHLYQILLAKGQVWDARDLIDAFLGAEGPSNTWELIFQLDIRSTHSFTQLLGDWGMAHYDESTYLAVLDILVSTSNALCSSSLSLPGKERLSTAERCLQHARSVATCLKENNPELVRCRPYARWILAEAEVRRKLSPGNLDLRSHLSDFPGLTVCMSTLPIYLPVKSENPTWYRAAGTPEHGQPLDDELLEAAVGVAGELGDYDTESRCRTELIYRSHDALDVVDGKLASLGAHQLDLQGDILAYQQTCLTRFLTTVTDQARQNLLAEMKEVRGRKDDNFSLGDWCVVVIERALSFSLGELTESERLAPLPEQFSSFLPQYIKDQVLSRGLDKAYGFCFKGEAVDSSRVDARRRRSGPLARPGRTEHEGKASYERAQTTSVHVPTMTAPNLAIMAGPSESRFDKPTSPSESTSSSMKIASVPREPLRAATLVPQPNLTTYFILPMLGINTTSRRFLT
ncbi:hypothetical protein BDV10DRAFT_192564 [Aspergillus recurvatus]